MGLLDAYADSIERNALGIRPKPVEPSFSLSATAATMGKAVPAGLLEGFGAVRDFSNAVDRRHAEEVAAREKRLGLAPSSVYVVPGGADARKKADEFMPDPLTAHAAQQIVGGFTKSITKAGVSMAVAGPTGGAVLFGGLEAGDVSMRLQDKGVDSGTAWQVGGVVGALSAVGVRLPVSGAAMATTTAGKVGATVGLGVAGGPVSFMAQEGLSREILQRAGYAEEAKLHDPYNPIGLAASLFPLAIGGVALRGALRKPIKTEADVRAAAALSPEEQARSDAFERSAGNIAELQAEIGKTKDPANRAILQAELDKQTNAAATEVRGTAADRAAVNPEAVDAARVAVLDETVSKALPDHPMAHSEMLRAADAVAAGERVSITPMILPAEREANFKAWFGDSKVVGEDGKPLVVYHGTGADFDAFDIRRAGGAIDAGKLGEGFYFTQDPRWAGRYAENAAKQDGSPSVAPVHLALKTPLVLEGKGDVWTKLRAISKEWGIAHDPVTDASSNTPNKLWARQFTQEAMQRGHDGVMLPSSIGQTEYVAFSANQMKSATGNSGRFDPNSASLTDPLEPNAPIPAQAANPEAAAPARGAGASPAAADAGRPAADVQAAGIAERTAAANQQTAQKLAEQNPDMPVRLPGEEKTTTLSAALERIREEQTRAAQEADLYQVAVTCFLTGGAAI